MRPILKASKQYSEYKNTSRLDGDKLVINGRRYGKNNLQQLPNKLKPMKVSTKEDSDTIGFFGELCPFSNFYEAEFIWNGYIYHCSEQYIQHQKAKYCGDVAAANEIMSCKLRAILLNTGDKTLVECSWDRVWGTGYPLSRPDCLDSNNWESRGLLGNLLMAVCEKLKPVPPVQPLHNNQPLALKTIDSPPKKSLETPTTMDIAPQPSSTNDI